MVFASLGLLFLMVLWGFASGEKIAQSRIVLQNFNSLKSALQYAYEDMDRFPLASEFFDDKFMKDYITPFPLPEFVSQTCPQNWNYKRPSQTSYEISFCLPRAEEGFSAGWNKFSGLPLKE